ncbi:MAG: response regulator transcription factor [Synergistaceae bacterium]|jgi:DNA-binding response OmpR family regulator|nr:response regulator transcription factor [Synergistaceae bacterium]
MHKQRKILIVDDEVKVLDVLSAYLSQSNYTVLCAQNGQDALRIFDTEGISLVILDLMLPDMTGEVICERIRASSRVPIIMLTAKVSEKSFLNGLDIGADDYLTKPFSPRIVTAKVKATLRRVECDELVGRPISYDGGLSIDFQNNIIKMKGKRVNLTPTEYKLLHTMAKAPDRIFSRDQLIVSALEDKFGGFDRSIDTYIKGLRAKIEPDRRIPHYIVTVRGIGYKFNAKYDDAASVG